MDIVPTDTGFLATRRAATALTPSVRTTRSRSCSPARHRAVPGPVLRPGHGVVGLRARHRAPSTAPRRAPGAPAGRCAVHPGLATMVLRARIAPVAVLRRDLRPSDPDPGGDPGAPAQPDRGRGPGPVDVRPATSRATVTPSTKSSPPCSTPASASARSRSPVPRCTFRRMLRSHPVEPTRSRRLHHSRGPPLHLSARMLDHRIHRGCAGRVRRSPGGVSLSPKLVCR